MFEEVDTPNQLSGPALPQEVSDVTSPQAPHDHSDHSLEKGVPVVPNDTDTGTYKLKHKKASVASLVGASLHQGVMDPEHQLALLCQQTSWEEFSSLATMTAATCAAMMEMVTSLEEVSIRQIPQCQQDTRRQRALKDRVPSGLHLVKATGDGNCLFRSASVLLVGKEYLANILRLFAVLQAVLHFDHYMTKYTSLVTDMGTAQQLLSSFSTEEVCLQRPTHAGVTCEEILMYMLREEAKNTGKNGAYSGPLQVEFLSGVLHQPIQQVGEIEADIMNSQVLPCSCCQDVRETLAIMWLRFLPTSLTYNHIAPLIPGSKRSKAIAKEVKSLPELVSDVCLMAKYQTCGISGLRHEDIDWVQCSDCCGWYHCICVGIGLQGVQGLDFLCCKDSTTANNSIVLQFPPEKSKKVKQVMLTQKDVRTLYPGQGLSDGVIDFFLRAMLATSKKIFLSPLTYQGIRNALDEGEREIRLQQTHKSVNGGIPIPNTSTIIFPCRLHDAWHWIVVAVSLVEEKAWILDSSPSAHYNYGETMRGITLFLESCVLGKSSIKLKVEQVKVDRQLTGYDCGVHIIHNMDLLARATSSQLPDFSASADASDWRRKLLIECYHTSVSYFKNMRAVPHPKRGCTSGTMEEQLKQNMERLRGGLEEGLAEVYVKEKGRGVVTTKEFVKNDLLCEYAGNVISHLDGLKVEEKYSKDTNVGCYMYFFQYQGKKLCIDATKEDKRLGRLINHSKTKANVVTKVVEVDGSPRLCLIAKRDIEIGEELQYDYGDRRKEAIELFPWLTK